MFLDKLLQQIGTHVNEVVYEKKLFAKMELYTKYYTFSFLNQKYEKSQK